MIPASAFALLATHSLAAQAPDTPPPGSASGTLGLIAGLAGLVVAAVAIVFAVRAQRLADHAVLEAGQARARASQPGGGLPPESLAAVERVWSARLGALEAQVAAGAPRAPGARAADRAVPAEFGERLAEIERSVTGLSIAMKELRRAPAAPAAPRREPSEILWPASLGADTPSMEAVRQSLAEALKSRDASARDLLERLRMAENWSAAKPGAGELAMALEEISTLLLAALRRGAAVAPLDSSLLSDRVLAALRPAWKSFQPQLDCRSFPPGATFDPDWMEDHTAAGLQRPVISEMLSWAVFEKLDAKRRILAKARVTAD